MAQAAHLSRKESDTLEERINNFRSAYTAYCDIQASQSLHNQPEFKDTLGTEEELVQAHEIIKTSLDMAVRDLSKSDLERAMFLGLISDMDLTSIGELGIRSEAPSNEQQIEENRTRIAEARSAVNTHRQEKSKDKPRDR
ncbi:MAG: hypothetical protein ACPF9K_14045 [Neptuniibacter sp.]